MVAVARVVKAHVAGMTVSPVVTVIRLRGSSRRRRSVEGSARARWERRENPEKGYHTGFF